MTSRSCSYSRQMTTRLSIRRISEPFCQGSQLINLFSWVTLCKRSQKRCSCLAEQVLRSHISFHQSAVISLSILRIHHVQGCFCVTHVGVEQDLIIRSKGDSIIVVRARGCVDGSVDGQDRSQVCRSYRYSRMHLDAANPCFRL